MVVSRDSPIGLVGWRDENRRATLSNVEQRRGQSQVEPPSGRRFDLPDAHWEQMKSKYSRQTDDSNERVRVIRLDWAAGSLEWSQIWTRRKKKITALDDGGEQNIACQLCLFVELFNRFDWN